MLNKVASTSILTSLMASEGINFREYEEKLFKVTLNMICQNLTTQWGPEYQTATILIHPKSECPGRLVIISYVFNVVCLFMFSWVGLGLVVVVKTCSRNYFRAKAWTCKIQSENNDNSSYFLSHSSFVRFNSKVVLRVVVVSCGVICLWLVL